MIRSSIERGSRMNVGSVIRLRSAPGRNCEIMCDKTTTMRKLSGYENNNSSEILVVRSSTHHCLGRHQSPPHRSSRAGLRLGTTDYLWHASVLRNKNHNTLKRVTLRQSTYCRWCVYGLRAPCWLEQCLLVTGIYRFEAIRKIEPPPIALSVKCTQN